MGTPNDSVNPLARAAKRVVTPESSTPSPGDYDVPYHWSQDANCRDKGYLMFPKEHKDISYITQARAICRACPLEIKEQCLDYALSFPVTDMNGVWAGLTPRQIGAEQQRRGLKPTKMTIAQMWAEFTNKDDE